MSKQADVLAKRIVDARFAYYNAYKTTISDAAYDALCAELKTIDPSNPALVAIGAPAGSAWKKARHQIPMGSLDKVKTPEEMTEWVSGLPVAARQRLFYTLKLDGISIELVYDKGRLVQAITRGDGTTGEDILANVRRMSGLPAKLASFSGSLRGEIVLRKSVHAKHFKDMPSLRNAAGGVSKRIDGTDVEKLDVFLYQVVGKDFKTEEDQFNWLEDVGAQRPNWGTVATTNALNTVWTDYQSKLRDKLDFDIDGLVVRVNDMSEQLSLGDKDMRPLGAVAYKFESEKARTFCRAIEDSVGNTGHITPVCIFDDVVLAGAKINRASLYNYKYIKQLGLDIGAEILISRAGDVIPRCEEVVTATGTTRQPPKKCPECGAGTRFDGDFLCCTDIEHCPAQVKGRIYTWIAQHNILEWGTSVVEKLVESRKVVTIADLYKLRVSDIASLDRMGEKSAQNCYDSLWNNTEITLDNFLGGLNIPLIGASMIRMVMDAGYDSLPKIMELSLGQLLTVPGFGGEKANALREGLQSNKQLIQDLLKNGVKIKAKIVGSLSGKTFCFTGTMKTKRAELETLVEQNGGTLKSVGKTLDYLVIDDPSSTSSKAQAARKFNIKLISEDQFLKMAK